jgi:ribosome-associated protein
LANQALELARMAGVCALDKRANDIKILDLREITSITDYFVICSGDVAVQVRAIADNILEKLEAEGTQPWHTEGYETGRWILLDFVDVVVHIFMDEAREYYGLERLWGDAPVEIVE